MEKFKGEKNEIIKYFKRDNLKLKNDAREKQIKIKNLNEELNSEFAEIKKLKTGLKCYKCDFQANTGNKFIIHLSTEMKIYGNVKNVILVAQKKKNWKIADLLSIMSQSTFFVQNVISYQRKI